jgi:hypothetical protein
MLPIDSNPLPAVPSLFDKRECDSFVNNTCDGPTILLYARRTAAALALDIRPASH